MRNPHCRIEDPQVVVNFGSGRNDRARIGPCPTLLDRNGRTETFDGIYLRLVQLIKELPRVGAQALHVTPLPLRIEGVKGQARFPAATQSGHHHQLPAGNVHIDIAQVVLPGSPDPYRVHPRSLTD